MRRFLPLILLIACTADKSPGPDDSSDDSSSDSGELTLDSCSSSVDAAVPAFYADLFMCSTLTVEGDVVVIQSDGLPPHRSYYYGEGHPNYEAFDTTRGADYHPNPNFLSEQEHELRVALSPVSRGLTITDAMVDNMAGTSEYEYRGGLQGLALDGVALFDGKAAPGDDIAEEKFTFDIYEGHPQNEGTYHYHSATPGPLEVLVHKGLASASDPGSGDLEIYGVFCDGTVMVGCDETDGSEPGDDLDGQGGHVHDILDPDGEVWLEARYHIHACGNEVPYSPEIQYYQDCN